MKVRKIQSLDSDARKDEGTLQSLKDVYRGILADVIVYIFAYLHRALRIEGKVLEIN